MRRFVAIYAIGGLLAALTSVYSGGAAAVQVGVKVPPRPAVRVLAVHPSQQLSFWGVDTNLQQSRDELQPAGPHGPHTRARLLRAKSSSGK
jgi:hypothetical protein